LDINLTLDDEIRTTRFLNKQTEKRLRKPCSAPATPQFLMQMRAKHKGKVASKMDLPATDYWLPIFNAAMESVRLINFLFHITTHM